MARYYFTILNCVLLVSLAVAEIPSYMQICGRLNPHLDGCIKESVEKLKPKLKTGIPELSVPSFEPLLIDQIALSSLDNFKALATKVELWGVTGFIIKKLHADLKAKKIEFQLLIPKVELIADYDVKARILVPVADKGPIHMISENVDLKITMKYEVVEKQGRALMYFSSMSTKLVLKDYEAIFTNSRDNPLSQGINSVLANSRPEIIENMTPNIEKALTAKLLDVANKIVRHFSYDELFPNRA